MFLTLITDFYSIYIVTLCIAFTLKISILYFLPSLLDVVEQDLVVRAIDAGIADSIKQITII